MATLNSDVSDHLKSRRVGVFAIEMPDGSPHAATLHFAATEDASMFFFLTSPKARKSEALKDGKEVRASFVVGSNEGDMRTLQLDGAVHSVRETEKQLFEEIYLAKFPDRATWIAEGLTFVFTPTWWRFSDMTNPEGKKVVSSEE
jgi:general stress protein 26